jgi:hypothetical protein
MDKQNRHGITISVEQADALEYHADVLVLKYARGHYGVDRAVSAKLINAGKAAELFMPPEARSELISTADLLGVENLLVVGVKGIWDFGYKEIREFARTALKEISNHAIDVKHVCLTLHGVGYGLDEVEAFQSELAGLVDAITEGVVPRTLEKITIVEQSQRRVASLQRALSEIIPSGIVELDIREYLGSLEDNASETFRTVGYASGTKPHVFVAMPFKDELEDVYEYGIQSVVRNRGYICERADLAAFTGDVMEWVKKRIATAALVIADLTDANPNVYLEVGYAWGVGIKTILLINDAEELKFDVRGQRCLTYKRIKHLEKALDKELRKLAESNQI